METAIPSESSVRFEGFELDFRTGELYRNGLRIKLRGHPVDVLAVLLEHPGELVTRETLKKRLWPDNTFVDFEQILNNSIGKLRDAPTRQSSSRLYRDLGTALSRRWRNLQQENKRRKLRVHRRKLRQMHRQFSPKRRPLVLAIIA